MWKGNSHPSCPIMPFRCNCKPLRIAPPPSSLAHEKTSHKHTPAEGKKESRGYHCCFCRQRDGEREREQAATSIHISQTIKLELAFNTSLTNCLLNKRLGLQHNRERFKRRERSGSCESLCVQCPFKGSRDTFVCTNPAPFMSFSITAARYYLKKGTAST